MTCGASAHSAQRKFNSQACWGVDHRDTHDPKRLRFMSLTAEIRSVFVDGGALSSLSRSSRHSSKLDDGYLPPIYD